jgi:hypothetical protein
LAKKWPTDRARVVRERSAPGRRPIAQFESPCSTMSASPTVMLPSSSTATSKCSMLPPQVLPFVASTTKPPVGFSRTFSNPHAGSCPLANTTSAASFGVSIGPSSRIRSDGVVTVSTSSPRVNAMS